LRTVLFLAISMFFNLAFAELEDWQTPYRVSLLVDAMQTSAIRSSNDWYKEYNPLYKHMGDAEAFVSVLAIGWLAEKAVLSIKHAPTRKRVGEILCGLEIGVVANNWRVGLKFKL
jgi:hypothetical protein